jgi:hypothetical protein
MGQYFDMMYYYLATFYKRFFKKRSGWDLQSIFVITITQTVLILDLYLLFNKLLSIKGKFSIYEKLFFFSLVLILLYLNIKKYEKKYLHYKEIWGVHQGSKKALYNFLTFFTVVFAWCFILIIGLIFNKN